VIERREEQHEGRSPGRHAGAATSRSPQFESGLAAHAALAAWKSGRTTMLLPRLRFGERFAAQRFDRSDRLAP
jgi:hypothetical protein